MTRVDPRQLEELLWQHTAWVSPIGSDSRGAVGDVLRPFATPVAALAALCPAPTTITDFEQAKTLIMAPGAYPATAVVLPTRRLEIIAYELKSTDWTASITMNCRQSERFGSTQNPTLGLRMSALSLARNFGPGGGATAIAMNSVAGDLAPACTVNLSGVTVNGKINFDSFPGPGSSSIILADGAALNNNAANCVDFSGGGGALGAGISCVGPRSVITGGLNCDNWSIMIGTQFSGTGGLTFTNGSTGAPFGTKCFRDCFFAAAKAVTIPAAHFLPLDPFSSQTFRDSGSTMAAGLRTFVGGGQASIQFSAGSLTNGQFLVPAGILGGTSATEVVIPSPRATTILNGSVRATAGGTGTWNLVLRKSAGDTPLVITIGAGATNASDVLHHVEVAQFERLSMRADLTAGLTSPTNVVVTFEAAP